MSHIKYNLTKDVIKTKAKEVATCRLKPWIIIGAVALPLSIFFLIVGYAASEPEALKMGYPALMISVLTLVLYIKWYYALKKELLAFFEKYGVCNSIECEIEKNGNDIRVANAYETFSFDLTDIKKLMRTKNYIVIMLKNNKLLALPARDDIQELFYYKN